ncbi:hypothetical protein SPHI_10730 [Sphingomonas jeddahensis]|uniref:Uncharacterized protein n=1 Tax=Sphingomonas jeddahensis TaxID=1915074 RepID=A0A1V2EX58_9SPHN|nr:hypothetical protein SPHI_10730 [Sphingomonas jeddahensis]
MSPHGSLTHSVIPDHVVGEVKRGKLTLANLT